MREALGALKQRTARAVALFGGLMAISIAIVVAVVGGPRGLGAWTWGVLAAGIGIAALLGGCFFWYTRNIVQRGLDAGHYARYSGPLRVESRGGKIPQSFLWLGDERIDAATIAPQETFARVRALDGGTVLYSSEAVAIFAIWDDAGQLAFQLPGYDADGDPELADLFQPAP